MTPALRAILLGGNRPSLDLSFLNGVDSRITFSGGVNGTVFNSSGAIVSASAPRLDYSPTSGSALGLLIEEARTNLLLNSKLDGTNLSTQSVTVTAQAYTLSFYGTGTVTLSGTATGAKVGAGAFPARGVFTFTPTAGTLTLTVSGTVQYANLEAGSFATSFMPTGGAAVTRTADTATMAITTLYNSLAGTLVIERDTLKASNTFQALQLDDGSNNNRIITAVNGSIPYAQTVVATVAGTADSTSAIADGATYKLGVSYASPGIRASLNGGTASVVACSIPAGLTTLRMSSDFASNWLDGHLKRVRYWPRQLSDSQMQRLTT